jgi:hypothetical protein
MSRQQQFTAEQEQQYYQQHAADQQMAYSTDNQQGQQQWTAEEQAQQQYYQPQAIDQHMAAYSAEEQAQQQYYEQHAGDQHMALSANDQYYMERENNNQDALLRAYEGVAQLEEQDHMREDYMLAVEEQKFSASSNSMLYDKSDEMMYKRKAKSSVFREAGAQLNPISYVIDRGLIVYVHV